MSALKTWILFFGVAFLLAACSDDSSPNKVVVENAEGDGSSENTGDSDKSGEKGSSGSSSKPTSAETIVINGGKDTIYVADAEGSLYYKSGVFCWTEGCEKNFTSASSQGGKSSSSGTNSSNKSSNSSGKSSSSSVKSSSSSAPPVPPTVTDKDMTDNRDGKKYKIEKIDNVTWMAENLRFEPSSGTYCDATVEVTKPGPGGETETVNVCDQYGMFYTSQTVASSACPYGWRLPTKDEVVAALAAKPGNWWTLGSRFDLESSNKFDESKIDKEGRLWIQTTSDDKNCVQLMNYGGGKDVTTDYLYASAGKRALNVRCVMSE